MAIETQSYVERTEWLRRMAELVSEQLEREHGSPVAEPLTPGEMARAVDLGISRDGEPIEDVIRSLDAIVEHTPRTGTRRFFNQLFSGRDGVATTGDMLACLMNSSMYTYKVAGPHAMIERDLIDRMGRLVGYERTEGVFAPGGSLAILSGMVMARDRAVPAYREDGPPERKLTLYASADGHYSVPKNAAMIGLGRASVRKIATDERGRMKPGELRAAIEHDASDGCLPFLVVATGGTTVLGAYDPIDEIADVCEAMGVWLHVDGCFGGSALLSEEHRGLLAGSARSDSFSWDAHKMMGVPLTCSVILTRHEGALRGSFDEQATYLFQSGDRMDEASLDFGTKSIQCGRRNDALKLFAAWKHHGDAGYDRRISHLFEQARHASEIVERDPKMTLTRAPESVTVCFEVEGAGAEDICERLRAERRALVGYAEVDGERVVRLACVNADATFEDIDGFFEDVRAVAGG